GEGGGGCEERGGRSRGPLRYRDPASVSTPVLMSPTSRSRARARARAVSRMPRSSDDRSRRVWYTISPTANSTAGTTVARISKIRCVRSFTGGYSFPRILGRRVGGIDERAAVLVLPPASPLVHRVAERHPGVGIGEPERAAGAEVPEGARARAERALGHRELEPEAEARGAPQHEVLAMHWPGAGARDGLRRQHAQAVEHAVARQRRIEPCDGARVAVAVGRRHLGGAPSARVDDAGSRQLAGITIG